MKVKWKLIVASLKMYVRQREALVWNLLLPLFMILLFGFVNFDGVGTLDVGIVNEAGTSAEGLLAALKEIQTLNVSEGTRESELAQLGRGERAAVAVIPPSYRANSSTSLIVYTNDGKPQESQLAALLLQRVFDEMAFTQHPPATRVTVTTRPVNARNLTYIDFLIPGILAMSIMQSGIFGVAFGFVSLKKRGILRRLWVTPINPNDFIIAQVITRLMVLMVQIVIMVGVGILFFRLHFIGSLFDMFVVGLLGGVVFLAIGFALAGISRSEDQVAPLANVITLPMVVLSGVFFSRSHLPGFIHAITDYFPLTYLADGMRTIAIDGASLASVGVQLIGLGVWGAASVFLAVKMFRWE